MQNAFFEWFLPRNAVEACVRAMIVTMFVVLANVGFAEIYLGYQPVGLDYLFVNIAVVATPWFAIFMIAMNRQRATTERLRKLSEYDGLTGLRNRTAFLKEVEARTQSGAAGVLIMLDADHFKAINDTLGHPAGDRCLANIARRLSNTLRTNDVSGRLGGEEFAVFLDGADIDAAQQVGERLLRPIHFRESEGMQECSVTLSIGAATLPANGSVEQRLGLADKALYAAKEAGRNCFRVWEAEQTNHQDKPCLIVLEKISNAPATQTSSAKKDMVRGASTHGGLP